MSGCEEMGERCSGVEGGGVVKGGGGEGEEGMVGRVNEVYRSE